MDHDPYFAGRPPDKPPTPRPLAGWTIVYGLNLIVPVIFGAVLTHEAGRIGMVFAILLLFWSGRWALMAFPQIRRSVIIGGSFVAAAQLFPLAQIYAGAIGISVARDMGQTIDRERIASELGGFVATVITGGVLLLAALGIGAFVREVSAGIALMRAGAAEAKKPGGIDVL